MESFTYPEALGGLFFCANRQMFRVVPVAVHTVESRHRGTAHSHDFFQFWYTVSGSWYHTAGGVTTKQEPGSAALIFPYTPHYIDTLRSDPEQLLVLEVSVKKQILETMGFPFQICSSVSGCMDRRLLPRSVTFTGAQKNRADDLCLEILSEFRKMQNMNSYKLLMLAAAFLELCAGCSCETLSARALNTARERSACIEETLTFLKSNLHRNLTLDEISSAAMMSRWSFTDSFYTVTGQSCGDYLRQVRMRTAVDMLRKTPMSISQVAEQAGFYDASHFYKLCMELYGVSPVRLRKDLSQWTRECGDRLYREALRELAWAHPYDEVSMERHRCAMSFY